MPKCSIAPPISVIAAGITSRRSAIADAPNTITSSAPRPSNSLIEAARSVSSCCTRRSAMMVAPAGANRSAVTRKVFSITFGDSPGSKVETTPTRLMVNGAIRSAPFPATATAASRNFASTPNGISLTVAIISPSTTGLNAASVANVIASSTPLMRSTAARSTTSTPACAANRLARPVKARSTLTPSPATACAMLAAATSSETSPSSSRTTTISLTPALSSASTSPGPIVVPFFSTSDPWRRVCTVTPPIASAGLAGPNFMLPAPSPALSTTAVRR